MPTIVWFINIPLDADMKFLGVSGAKREEVDAFLEKLKLLCQVMGWSEDQITREHCFKGQVVDRFPSVNGSL